MLHSVTTERSAADRREHWVARLTLAFAQPNSKHCHRLRCEWRAAILTSFATATYVGAASQVHISARQPGHLGDAQASLQSHQEQGAVAATDPRGSVGGSEESSDLGSSQEADQCAVETLLGNAEHALYERGVLRMAKGGEAKKRMDGG